MKHKWLGLVVFVIGMISFGCGQKQANERIQATDQQGVYTVQLQEKEGFVVKVEDKKAVEIAKDKYPTAMKLQLSIKVDKNGYEIKLKDKKSDIGATSRLKLNKSYQYAAFVANKNQFPEKLGSMIFTNEKKSIKKHKNRYLSFPIHKQPRQKYSVWQRNKKMSILFYMSRVDIVFTDIILRHLIPIYFVLDSKWAYRQNP